LYIGVTSNLIKRVWEHKQKFVDGFAEKHNAMMLVYYELHDGMSSAIVREKALKNWNRQWNRQWKLHLFEKTNPYWLDLWNEINN